ncbi:putative carboxylesterase 11 [Hibiscus syriacus]|uniref:Carboxylesterase 11 n=1 Tax=Hibiscus syriacus TaxID=106335 RepID=A0A6A3B1I1_HIBSY|nr:putative carboxylesterase 11 [Hibiscus syriacus]
MSSVALKLYSVFFKFVFKHRLQNLIQSSVDESSSPYGVTTRPEESVSASNPSFTDGVATKDIHIDPFTALSIRIFLPESSLSPPEQPDSKPMPRSSQKDDPDSHNHRRSSYGPPNIGASKNDSRRIISRRWLGEWSSNSIANDYFCRRIAKLCDVIVVAVGYRLAPESKYPAAFEDGFKVLNWLAKQANLAECSKSLGNGARGAGSEFTNAEFQRHFVDAFGASMVEPWLAAHGDQSRCVLLGVSCGANIADYVARKAVEAGKLLDPVKVVAQVLMYPFFIGNVPTQSEIKLANSYFYDKAMCLLAWKLFLTKEEFSLDHPAANPLIPDRGPPLKLMPPTLTVVAEHDWMRDRAIAYSEALRKVNVDAPVLEYKDAVHEFATHGMLLKTPQAEACAEDIAIWVKKYISFGGHEFSY